MASKTLILGLGNPIHTHDGVGIHVVRAVAAHTQQADLVFGEASVGGLRLLDTLVGYERVILVDAIQTHGGRPGDVYLLHPNDLRASLHSGSTHDLVLPTDQAVAIVAVEVEDVLTFGESCTPAVAAAIPRAVEMTLACFQGDQRL
jgi:hydrogenase maturation protease